MIHHHFPDARDGRFRSSSVTEDVARRTTDDRRPTTDDRRPTTE
jgi:hypothetical protein